MLTEIRDRSSGWFAWIIAALIIIPMAFWGVQEYANTDANPSLIEVGDQKVTQAQFQSQFNNQQQRLRQSMGEQVNNDYLTSDGFKQSVFQQVLNRALIEQVALENNYRIGDAQLAELIKKSELFQVEGKFDQSAYDRYVATSQYSKDRYENALRADQRLAQVTAGYEESALVLPDEIRSLLEIQAEKRNFDVITVKQQDYVAGVVVDEGEIQAYYDENQQSFLADEQVSVSYLELNLEDIAATITVDEDSLRATYEDNLESYISQEKRETRHILLSTTADQDEATQLSKAQALVTELNAGADFAELAKSSSDDPGSAAVGGNLGLIETGQMVPEFENATFSLAEGMVSEPIKTQFGYHIIQVTKVQAPEQQSFEDVKFDLQQDEKDRLAEDELLEKADQLRDLAFEQSDSLVEIAEVMGLKVLTTEPFSRSQGVGIATSSIIRNAAFSDEVLVDNINSEPLEVSEAQYVVLRKENYQASEPKVLSDVSEQVKQILISQKARAAAQVAGEALLAKAELNWESAATSANPATSFSVALIDQNLEIAPDVLREVASMHLKNGASVVNSVTGLNGDYNLIRLTGIEKGDVNAVNEQIKSSTRQVLSNRNGQSLVRGYIDSLNETMKPVVNTDLL